MKDISNHKRIYPNKISKKIMGKDLRLYIKLKKSKKLKWLRN